MPRNIHRGECLVEIKAGPNLVLLTELITKLTEVCEMIPEWQQYEAGPILKEMEVIIQKMFR